MSRNNKLVLTGISKKEMIYNLINSNSYFEDCKESMNDGINSVRGKSINTIINESINLTLSDLNKIFIIYKIFL